MPSTLRLEWTAETSPEPTSCHKDTDVVFFWPSQCPRRPTASNAIGATTMSNTKGQESLVVDDLPECLRILAHQELGETAVVRRQALKQLRQLLSDEPSLHFTADEDTLLIFLRARKYDVPCAFNTIKRYFKARRENPDMFDALCLHSVPFHAACRQHQLVTLSRKTDPKGRPVLMLNLGKGPPHYLSTEPGPSPARNRARSSPRGTWNTSICSLDQYYRVGILHIMHIIFKDCFQMTGVVIVVDFKNLGPYHLAHYTPYNVRKFVKLVQDCCPMRIKEVYVINNPAVFDILFAIAKPFLKHKLVKRFHLLGYDLNKLHGLVPDDLIPEKYGGTLESYDYDDIERELKARDEVFEQWNSYGYREAAQDTV
ncbi:hypothetical protein V5799_021497 [Amblyomma americanum]|uniref:CRAL-TRIO domain-containing protein n=1 Tax=Amblyomma americanum TaxID=6943 RepID=A0AAQ4FN75_AMBAM